MRQLILVLLFAHFIIIPAESQLLKKLKKEVKKIIGIEKESFTAEEAAKAIKEALVQGTSKGTDIVSKVDGFYANPEIKIPFPPGAQKVESTLREVGLGKYVDDVVLSLNRAAEDACGSAKDIFVAAITEMTIDDAINIVKGDTNSATRYLRGKTTAKLTETFSPIIKTSLDKVNATKYWSDAMNAYNKIPFVEKVNPDLTQYVTEKALNALFLMIAREEVLIRKDPIARTTELLKKVFGK
jgi:hypothetical protein